MQKLFLGILLLFAFQLQAQIPGGGRPGGGQNMNMGRFYGRIVDGKTNKSIEAASVQLFQNKMDTAYWDHIGPSDEKLIKKIILNHPSHRKFLRQIQVWASAKMSLDWWFEFDTYLFQKNLKP